MFLRVFCVVFFLLQCRGHENKDSDFEYESLSMEEYDKDLSPVFDFPEIEDDNFMELKEASDDANSIESPSDDGVSFAGPVKAKGSVSVTATFGTAPSLNYPQYPLTNPIWLPQYFLPTIPYVSPMPLPVPHVPLSIFTPGIHFAYPELKNSMNITIKDREKPQEMKTANEEIPQKNIQKELTENAENSQDIYLQKELETANGKSQQFKQQQELTASKNDFFLQLIPLTSTKLTLSNDIHNECCDEIFSSSKSFPDEDFTDHEENKDESNKPVNDGQMSRSFAGFIPASGSVHITARF